MYGLGPANRETAIRVVRVYLFFPPPFWVAKTILTFHCFRLPSQYKRLRYNIADNDGCTLERVRKKLLFPSTFPSLVSHFFVFSTAGRLLLRIKKQPCNKKFTPSTVWLKNRCDSRRPPPSPSSSKTFVIYALPTMINDPVPGLLLRHATR